MSIAIRVSLMYKRKKFRKYASIASAKTLRRLVEGFADRPNIADMYEIEMMSNIKENIRDMWLTDVISFSAVASMPPPPPPRTRNIIIL